MPGGVDFKTGLLGDLVGPQVIKCGDVGVSLLRERGATEK